MKATMTKKQKYYEAIDIYEDIKGHFPQTVKRVQYWGSGMIHGPDDLHRPPSPSGDWHMLCNMEWQEYLTLLEHQQARADKGRIPFTSLVHARRLCHDIQDAWYRHLQPGVWRDVSDEMADFMYRAMQFASKQVNENDNEDIRKTPDIGW